MVRRGTNIPASSAYNQVVVLDAVRREHEGISRVKIAEQTGMGRQTVSNAARDLMDEGLIRENGTVISGRGKPRTILRLEPTARYAVGVHLDPAVATTVLVDLAGHVVAQAREPLSSSESAAGIVAEIARAVDRVVSKSAIDRARVIGVGVASPGPIDSNTGTVLDPPLFPQWRDVRLGDELGRLTDLPVLVEKDVTAAAVAELWFGKRAERSDFVFVYYGTGIGMGLVVEQEIVRGSTGNAGDSAHITVCDVGPEGPRGPRGSLGDLVSPRELVRRAVEEGVLELAEFPESPAPDVHLVDEAFTKLAKSLTAEDPRARAIVEEAGFALAQAVVVVVNLLDLDHVVFGGPFWARIAPTVLGVLPEAVTGSPSLVPKHPIHFEESSIGEDVAAIGAACVVLYDAFTPRPSSLPRG